MGSQKRSKVNSSFEAVGAFWSPDAPDGAFGGLLTARSGRVELLTSPSYKRLTQAELHEALMAFGKWTPPVRIEVLHGRTSDDPCSLFWLQELSRPGLLDHGDGTELSSIRYRASASVIGLHLSSADAEEIEEAHFSFSALHTFFAVPLTWERSDEVVSFSYPSRGTSLFRFSSLSLEAEVEFEVLASNRQSHKKGLALKNRPRVRVKPNRPRSLVWFADLRTRLENFFSLILGTSVATNRVRLLKGGKSGFLLEKRLRRKEKANYQTRITCPSHILGGALAKWLAIPADEQPVERTFLMVVRKSRLFTETEFLSLAQAIEGFGRIRFKECLISRDAYKKGLIPLRSVMRAEWGDSPIVAKILMTLAHANEVSFGERIGKMYDMLSAAFASSVCGDKEQFVRAIVQTRNLHTHPSIKAGASIVEGSKLFFLNQRLAGFLRCVMLLALDVPEDMMKEAISYQCHRWR